MRFYLSQVTRSSISKLYCFLFLALAIYERFAVKIHVYHDAAPGLAQVPVLWLESYCGLSNGRSDDLVALTTLYSYSIYTQLSTFKIKIFSRNRLNNAD